MKEDRAASMELLEAHMKVYTDKVNRALEKELKLYSHSRFYEPIQYAVGSGKRIRPVILMLSAEALGRQDDSILGAAVAVELLHTESIVHDDVIDNESSRRTKAPFHVKYGYSASLLSADFVFAVILAIATRYDDRRIAEEVSNAALRMAEGEYSELTIDPKTYKLTWDEYLKIVTDKTAALFESAARLGAMMAGAGEKEVQSFAEYGKSLGIAYQLKDDLLDWRSKDKVALCLLKTQSESAVVGKMTALAQTYAEAAKTQLLAFPRSEPIAFLQYLADLTLQRKS